MPEDESTDIVTSDFKDQLAALQRQVFSMLLALIVVSGTVTIYLYRQASLMRKDMEAIKPQADQIVNTFNQNKAGMVNFINQLNEYGKTHPDIQQILLKNGFSTTAPKK